MKILVVVESIDINDSSGSKANVALLNNLHSAGFELLVYHYTRKDIHLDGIDCVSVQEKKWNLLFLLSRSERIFSRYTKINLNPYLESWFGFSFTFFNDTNSITKAIKNESKFNPDFVLTLSKGASFRPHYSMLQIPELHDKWLAYVHDPYPFHFYPRPYNWVQSGFRQKERFFGKVAEKAKFSAFPSKLLQEWMGSYFSQFLESGVVIPHQNLKSKISEIELPTYFDRDKFNILHAGNLLNARSPIGLIEGFKIFCEKWPNAKMESNLILIGAATGYSEILKKYQQDVSGLIVYDGVIDFSVVNTLQKNVSVNVILEAKSEISPFLPAKFPHCVDADRKILLLSPFYSETRRLLGKNYEFWAENDDIVKIAALIESLYLIWKQNPDDLSLNRNDLEYYHSEEYLKQIILGLNP